MKLLRLLQITITATALSATALSTPVNAVELPAVIGDFQVTFAAQPAPDRPDPATANFECNLNGSWVSDMTTIGTALMMGGLTSVSCRMSLADSNANETNNGTVKNTTLGLNGTLSMLCDSNINSTVTFDLVKAGMSVETQNFSLVFTGLKSCSWTISAQNTQGAISTLNGVADVPISSVATASKLTPGTALAVTVRVNGSSSVTGGSGLFADVQGTSILNENFVQEVPIEFPDTGSFGGGGGGGDLPPCTDQQSCMAYCIANPTDPFCNQPPPNLSRLILRTVRPLADSASVTPKGKIGTWKLSKATGSSILFAVPRKVPGSATRVFGKTGLVAQKLRLATKPSSKCTLTAIYGAKQVALLPAVGNQFTVPKTGVLATSYTAAVVASKLGLKPYLGKTASIAATCTAGLAGANVTKVQTFKFADS